MKKYRISISLLFILFSLFEAVGQVPEYSKLRISPSQLDSIDIFMQNKVNSNSLAGVEYLIANKSEIIHHQAIGFRDIEIQDSLEKNSLFRIYSATKPFTAAAVLILVERGLLSLEDTISNYIPKFKNMRVLSSDSSQKFIQAKREVTIYDLLTYQSGFGYIKEYWDNNGLKDSKTLKEYVLKLSNIPLTDQPGEGYQYGVASNILAYLVEIVSGVKFNVFLKQNIFMPLEMYDTDYVVPKGKRNRLVSNYKFDKKENKLQLLESSENSKHIKGFTFYNGSSDIVTTVTDYLIFSQMLLNGGAYNDKRIIGEKYVKLMTCNQLPDNLLGTAQAIRKRGWGMGVWVANEKTNHFPNGTFGKAGGSYTTLFWVDKSNELIGIIFLQTNKSYSIVPNFIKMIYD